MTRNNLALCLAGLVATTCFAADTTSAKLVQRAGGETPLMEDLKELCDRIGGRPTGSVPCNQAIDWATQKLKKAGLANVTTESFTLPSLWLPKTAEAAAISPVSFPLRIAAAPFSASMMKPIDARLVDAGDGSIDAFAKLGPSAKGAIALVHSVEMKTFEDLFAEYTRNAALIEGVKQSGVAGLLLESTRPRGLLYRHPLTLNGMSTKFPAAILARENAERLARLLEKGEVRVHLMIVNRTGGPFESKNVVAEIRGREKPDEVVLLGAHLDSWDLGTGAEDNGINAAMVIDIARAFAQLGITPRRTVRFVLFTGEEQGLWGSVGYVKKHQAELDNHVAALIFDTGSGRTKGFYLNGRDELRKPVNDALASAGLAASAHTLEGMDGTDNFDFLLSGVPNLVAAQDPIPYLPDYHAESDTVDRVNVAEAKRTEAIAAAMLWAFAENPERIAKRQTRSEVEKLLVDTKLDEQMKLFGLWDSFQSGKRGLW